MLVHRRVTPSSKFTGTHLYTWVERCTMRVKYLAQEHNAVPRPGLKPGPPDPESSALTIRPPHLPPRYKRPFKFTSQQNSESPTGIEAMASQIPVGRSDHRDTRDSWSAKPFSLGSYVTCVLHTARISNVISIDV